MKDVLTRLLFPLCLLVVPWSNLFADDWTLSTDTGSHSFHALAAASSTAVWAAASGSQGQIFFFNGTSWSLQTTTFPAGNSSLRGAYAIDASHVWAGGIGTTAYSGPIFFFNGSSWVRQTALQRAVYDVYAADTNNIWASGFEERMHRSTNGGSSWALETDFGTDSVFGIDGLDAQHVWCVTGPAPTGQMKRRIFFYNGTAWSPQTLLPLNPTKSLRDIVAVSETEVWATGDDNLLLRYDGASWTVASSGGASTGDYPIAALSSGELRAAPADGTNSIQRYSGAAWSVETNVSAAVRSLNGSVPGSAWAGTDNGMIFHLHFASPTASPSPVPSPSPSPDYDNHSLQLDYSTYLGGSGWDQALDMTVDSSECAYLVGDTDSTDFPTVNPLMGTPVSSDNVFVSKFSSTGTALLFSTLLGGSSTVNRGYGIAVDSLACVYVTGRTDTSDFPTVNPYQASLGGPPEDDAFISKLDSMGSVLLYSTYLGGEQFDQGYGIAVDPDLCAYVGGGTLSTSFPTLNAYQGIKGTGIPSDAFLTKLGSAGSSLVFSTYLGGNSSDNGQGIAIDSFERAYLCGCTGSVDFPTINAYQPDQPQVGIQAAFASRFTSSGSALDYSTYFGGDGNTFGYAIAIGSAGETFLAGCTGATDLPVPSAYQASNAGGPYDAYAACFDPSGSALVYSTYLGGTLNDEAFGIVLDGEGKANLAGYTQSDDFPTRNPYQASRAGSPDAFVARLTTSGSRLLFSTFLGGSIGSTWGYCVAASGQSLVYAAGYTTSFAFPTRNPYQAVNAGSNDAFLSRLNFTSPSPTPTSSASPTPSPVPSCSSTPSPAPSATPTVNPTSTPAPTSSPTPTANPTATPSPSPSPTIVVCISISGDVRDKTTTLPVSGASIRAVTADGPSSLATTDAYGFFGVFPCTHFPSGAVRAEARHPDFLPAVVETSYSAFTGVAGVRIEMMPVSAEPGVVSSDFDGDGADEIALFRPPSSQWAVRDTTRIYFGGAAEDLVPADYDGDGTAEAAIFRPSTGMWAIHDLTRVYSGDFSDVAVPGDYDGDGTADLAVFRQRSLMWAVNRVTRIYFGAADDQPAGADFTGDGRRDFAVFRRSSGMWAIRDITRTYFGSSGDRVVPGDYDGNGSAEPGIFRPASGLWSIKDATRAYLGNSSDHPVPADYNGGGADLIGIFRESSGLWSIRGTTRAYFGATGDIPVTR
jgi:cell division septation protein DedD